MKINIRNSLLAPTLFFLVLPGSLFGQQPEPPLPEESLLHFEEALEKLAEGKLSKAERILGRVKPGGEGSLREILTSLLNGYSEFERHLPNETIASYRAHESLKEALRHAEQGKVGKRQYQQALSVIWDFLDSLGSDREAPIVRSLGCNLRMLSGEAPVESESIGMMTEEVRPPKKIFAPIGPYTDAARKARVSGVVISRIVIDSKGCVESAGILKGLPLGLDESTADAFKWWSFEPARLDGKSIAVYYSLTTQYTVE